MLVEKAKFPRNAYASTWLFDGPGSEAWVGDPLVNSSFPSFTTRRAQRNDDNDHQIGVVDPSFLHRLQTNLRSQV